MQLKYVLTPNNFIFDRFFYIQILMKRISEVIETEKIITNHQFSFGQQHGTIEEIHRIVDKVNKDTEERRYCAPVFSDITQAFDQSLAHKFIL